MPGKATSPPKTPQRTISPLAQQLSRIRANRPDMVASETITPLRDFLPAQFRSEHDQPYKRLGSLTEIWQVLVPMHLLENTMLKSFYRGTLTVAVDSSATLYTLDRLMREGLESRIRMSYRGSSAIRRIRLVVNERPFTRPGSSSSAM